MIHCREHTSSICKSAYYHIRPLRHIRSSITDDMAKLVASSLVCFGIDYANFLHLGTTQKRSIVFSAPKTYLLKPRIDASHAFPRGAYSFHIFQDLH